VRSPKASRCLGALLGVCALIASAAAEDGAPVAVPTSPAILPAAIDSAVSELKHDPNLGGETKVRTLKWTSASRPTAPSELPRWILGFFDFLSQLSGLLLWAAGAIAVAVAAIWGYRHLRWRPPREPSAQIAPAAARIFDLDISPDSLPDDVAAAALSLSRAGKLRESLSLLYRASLSRAVSRFGAVIGPSLTEREALGAVRASLDEPRARYVADLVKVWQRVVYAGDVVAPDDVAQLCTRFGDTLDEGVRA
jgi:hypothetical protein